jgi:hypothetical protein
MSGEEFVISLFMYRLESISDCFHLMSRRNTCVLDAKIYHSKKFSFVYVFV